MKFFDDTEARPDLFQRGRGADPDTIAVWERANLCQLPPDIGELWSRFGTGTFFETEELFGLDVDPITGESAEFLTPWYRDKGLRNGLILLHRGFNGLSFIELETGDILQVDEETMTPVRSFHSVDEWYAPIRAEFALRYHLK